MTGFGAAKETSMWIDNCMLYAIHLHSTLIRLNGVAESHAIVPLQSGLAGRAS
jgi:hypothetical protein